MSRTASFAILALALVAASPLSAGSIKRVLLEEGRTDENRIVAPIFEGSTGPVVLIGEITSAVPRDQKVIANLNWGRVPDPTLGPAIDVGALLAQAMTGEGAQMGIRTGGDADGAWRVSGRVDDLAVKVRPIVFGPLVFYGYLQATLTVAGPDGESGERSYQVFNVTTRYNGGMGMEDEVSEALAQLLVESGQELLSRLDRDFFDLPRRAGIGDRARALIGQDVDGRESELLTIGLSHEPEALQPLLGLLESERDEDDRVHVIDALGNLGLADAVPVLIRRFAGEENECRYATLDALQILGGEEARGFVVEHGARDEAKFVKLVADRVREGS